MSAPARAATPQAAAAGLRRDRPGGAGGQRRDRSGRQSAGGAAAAAARARRSASQARAASAEAGRRAGARRRGTQDVAGQRRHRRQRRRCRGDAGGDGQAIGHAGSGRRPAGHRRQCRRRRQRRATRGKRRHRRHCRIDPGAPATGGGRRRRQRSAARQRRRRAWRRRTRRHGRARRNQRTRRDRAATRARAIRRAPSRSSTPTDGASHCYWPRSSSQTWSEAQQSCTLQNGHLVTILSAEENAFVVSVAQFSSSFYDTWIGATDGKAGGDKNGPGTYKWVTNETWGYSNWEQGQPDGFCDPCSAGQSCTCDHRAVLVEQRHLERSLAGQHALVGLRSDAELIAPRSR